MKRVVLFLCLFLPLVGWAGPLFHRGTEVREVSTKYFRILYAAGDENTAHRLASLADSIYEEWFTRLGLKKTYSFLVILTPHIEAMNGMFTSLPRNTIILYNYIENPLYVPSDDALRSLFTHELLHAISLNVKTPTWDFLSTIYGDFLSPQLLQQPWWMVEGITVSGESFLGHGRVNSPSHRALLVQHFLERKFEDVTDVANFRFGKKGYYHYIYGGFFSDYLQKRYGWEKYAELWKKSASAFWPYSFDTTFKSVYGASVEEEWAQFATTFVLSVSRPNLQYEVVYKGDELSLRNIGEEVYLIDEANERIYHQKEKGWVFAGEGRDIAGHGDVRAFRQRKSKEGKPQDGFVLKKGKKQMGFFSRFMDMDVLGDTYLGVQAEGLMSKLVLIEQGKTNELLPAHPNVQYMFPRFVSEEQAVWITLVSNRPFLGVWERGKGDIRFYDLSRYEVTSLSVYSNEVWMVVFPRGENTLGRVAKFSLQTEELWVSGVEVLGGFYKVAATSDTLYLVQRFSEVQQCIRVNKEHFLVTMEGEMKKSTAVALEIAPMEEPPQFVSRSGRRSQDYFPGVRVPFVYPEPSVLFSMLQLSLVYDLWLYHEDPLQENAFSARINHGAAYSPWTMLDGEWENRYFYPFSTVVGGTAFFSSRLYYETLRLGFSYQWDIASRNVVLWQNRAFFVVWEPSFSTDHGRKATYQSSLTWSMSDGSFVPFPYPIFRGPLYLEARGDDGGDYSLYGTAVYSYNNLSLGVLGGWGSKDFFSPLDIPRGNFLFGLESLATNMPIYQRFIGGHGYVVWTLPIEAGYKHFPVYFDSLGAVAGTYALYLQRGTEAKNFYALYLQMYSKWIVGYILPLSLVTEMLWPSEVEEGFLRIGIATTF
ncbi:hypothetical protein [Thermospira aquatica]|uniref:Uncharacterized protein n=1 Tax=Thermospira aquatica TaxID=2828656 RepID=A0AAX3BBB2_9SPIR|nr:hypothetical protein [Thermospira aquatica]URA09378.1 hypothetical protein KDW03_07735 [Thermospira aquatica]